MFVCVFIELAVERILNIIQEEIFFVEIMSLLLSCLGERNEKAVFSNASKTIR